MTPSNGLQHRHRPDQLTNMTLIPPLLASTYTVEQIAIGGVRP